MSYYRRLATLLATDPAQATADDVRRLLNNPRAAEDQDLDYKLEPHANGTEGGGELAKDIAAFANSTGGVLVLGLQDDRRTSVPVHDAAIPLTDALRRRYSETLASRTAPIIDVDIHFAPETGSAPGAVPQGFALVMVAPSPGAPHAVLGLNDPRDGCLRFPVRSGSRIRFMSPAEVETALLDRQTRRAQRERRHGQLLEAIAEQQSFGTAPVAREWAVKVPLSITLVPHVPGSLPWDRAAFERYRQQVRAETTLLSERHTTFDEVEPIADGFVARHGSGTTRQVIAVFGEDGSAGIEYPLSPEPPRGQQGGLPDEALRIGTGELTEVVVSALGVLARHATDRARATGGCTVRLAVRGPWARFPGETGFGVRSVALTSGSRQAEGATAEIGTFVEDLVVPGSALIETADLLLTRVGRRFGQVESPYTASDGTVIRDQRTPYFPGELYRWAEQVGVTVQPR
ncbi:helix-turn-helix domain-containing protein [Streptomyces sp. NPDC101175]|uniref:AlbA family DNA-binding domain-containing protein n=1 Tax=Streptomyces sp. NPDC101175 TaxID=3366123 RepID=UPI0038385051